MAVGFAAITKEGQRQRELVFCVNFDPRIYFVVLELQSAVFGKRQKPLDCVKSK